MLIMWKPVRLQGVGAASSIINANTHPAGKLLDPWRRHINCLFGLTLNGVPIEPAGNPNNRPVTPYDSTGTFSCPETSWTNWSAGANNPQVDRLPLEATVSWDATLNGNLAELLQEPSLMGAYEGGGITVLGKGLDFHSAYPWNDGFEAGAFPTVTTLLTGTGVANALPVGDANPLCTDGPSGTNRFTSNFMCNPSTIDGLAVTNSSQGGGGIFVHGWAHNLQIANNRVYNNTGTLSGGISVGQGEFAPPYIQGGATNAAPGSCSNGVDSNGLPFVTNQHLPMCLELQVNVHNNFITHNSSIGDELFSATLAGAGGVSFCTGNDYYKFNYNWVCGNLSSGEGGGVVHLGEIFDGRIEHNSILFNQSINPTIPTNGGGIMVQGTPDTDPVCGSVPDQDCPPGLSDGTGPRLVINANLIQGNSADSGSGGGVRLQQVNGTEVSTFPKNPELWHDVTMTNNIIVNNVAGWDGAGVSLQDALKVNIINNTIAHNDSTASSGVLNTSLGAPLASSSAGNCAQAGPTGPLGASCPQVAGLVSMSNSPLLTTTFTGLTITCPAGHYAGTNPANGTCTRVSYPALYNDVFWQNRSFQIGVGGLGTGTQNQQNTVALFNAAFNGTSVGAAVASQTSTGSCPAGASYWDIGVRGDTGPANHSSSVTLNPRYSVLSPGAGYGGGNNITSNPTFISQYCNGSRIPPECTLADGCVSGGGWSVPPGIADSVVPNPVFSLTPAATVDEGNNWINVTWGPLSLTNPAVKGLDGNWGGGLALGDYGLAGSSGAIDRIPPTASTYNLAPPTDFFGNPRPDASGNIDVGAVESQNFVAIPPTLSSIAPNTGARGTSVQVTLTGTHLTGASAVNAPGSPNITVTGVGVVSDTTVVATLNIAAITALGAHNITVTTPNGPTNAVVFTVTGPTLTSIAPTSGARGNAVPVTLTGTNLTGASAVSVTGGNGGVTCAITGTPTTTTVNATCTITSTATLGARSVRVNTPNGQTPVNNAVTFTVRGPTVTAISPTAHARGGASFSVTITGTDLTGATDVTFSTGTGGAITATITGTPTSTTVTANVTIPATAQRTARTVRVNTPNGQTPVNNAVTLTVQ
jgi:hypothetical protein